MWGCQYSAKTPNTFKQIKKHQGYEKYDAKIMQILDKQWTWIPDIYIYR